MPSAVTSHTNIIVEIDGCAAPGLLQATITSTNRFSADAFSLTFAMGDAPLSGIAFWSALSSGRVEVLAAGMTVPVPASLITGMIDQIHLDAIRGTVSLEGRDLSSSMVDTYRQDDFVNQTASEIVSAIANRHGLGATVSPTSGLIGRYYGDGYTRLSTGQFTRLRSDWDLVTELARENGFDVFIEGTQLFFQPPPVPPTIFTNITPGLVQRLTFDRTLAITADTPARVQSWDSQNITSYDSYAQAESAKAAASSTSQPYLFSASNFTADQVTRSAARYTAEVNRLGTRLLIEMPWDLRILPRTGIMLTETGSSFDGPYLVDDVERHYSSTRGSRQAVRAISIAGSI